MEIPEKTYTPEELEETSEMEMVEMSGSIQRQATGLFVAAEERKQLQGQQKTITILALGYNKFKNPFLTCIMDDEERNLNINGKNINQLREILGSELSKWVNAKVNVLFKAYSETISGQLTTGTTLEFSSL